MKGFEIDVTPFDGTDFEVSGGTKEAPETKTVTYYPAPLLHELLWSNNAGGLRDEENMSKVLRVSEVLRAPKKRKSKQYVQLTVDEHEFLLKVLKLIQGWNENQWEARHRVVAAKDVETKD